MNIRRTFAIACVLVLGTAHAPAGAEPTLADPTRPPGFVQSATAPARTGVAAASAPVWPQLQSVQVSAHGKSSALLDGRVVGVGERMGESTLMAIDAQGVLLRRGHAEQRLALLPGVAKTPGASAPPAFQSATATAAATATATAIKGPP